MAQLQFSRDELLSNHDYATPHVVGGQRIHGGFDATGSYVPPRSKLRNVAIENWTQALRARGGDLLDADASLLRGLRVPNVEQQQLMLRAGLARPFWNGLTITGKIEARGRVLNEMAFPDLQPVVVEDIGSMALGHMNSGLLSAHGIDEGGEPDKGIGGHDVMWFVARDLALGANAFPDVDPPESVGRPDAGARVIPELAQPIEAFLGFLMNLLIIEFRAEIGFANTQAALRTADLFVDRRDEAQEAAEIVGRIRTDELIHVTSLRLYLGELRALTLRTVDGGTLPGATVVDRYWSGLVRWATVEQPRLAAERQFAELRPQLVEHDSSGALLATFEAASDAGFDTLAASAG